MNDEIRITEGLSIKLSKMEQGLQYALIRLQLNPTVYFENEEQAVVIPADITGLDAKPDGWVVLELQKGSAFTVATAGDLLAVRKTRRIRNGQVGLVKTGGRILLRRVFQDAQGVLLRDPDGASDLLIRHNGVEVRGTVEGIRIAGAWYRLNTSERFPDH